MCEKDRDREQYQEMEDEKGNNKYLIFIQRIEQSAKEIQKNEASN